MASLEAGAGAEELLDLQDQEPPLVTLTTALISQPDSIFHRFSDCHCTCAREVGVLAGWSQTEAGVQCIGAHLSELRGRQPLPRRLDLPGQSASTLDANASPSLAPSSRVISLTSGRARLPAVFEERIPFSSSQIYLLCPTNTFLTQNIAEPQDGQRHGRNLLRYLQQRTHALLRPRSAPPLTYCRCPCMSSNLPEIMSCEGDRTTGLMPPTF